MTFLLKFFFTLTNKNAIRQNDSFTPLIKFFIIFLRLNMGLNLSLRLSLDFFFKQINK